MRVNNHIWIIHRPYRSCDTKLRFNTRAEAEEALEEYHRKIPLNTMQVYPCPKHNAYHHGHSRRYPKRFFERMFEERSARYRKRNR